MVWVVVDWSAGVIEVFPAHTHLLFRWFGYDCAFKYEQRHEISNNVVCATSKGSDQPAHTRSLLRAFACRLNIL